jgi:hypothetical protein
MMLPYLWATVKNLRVSTDSWKRFLTVMAPITTGWDHLRFGDITSITDSTVVTNYD